MSPHPHRVTTTSNLTHRGSGSIAIVDETRGYLQRHIEALVHCNVQLIVMGQWEGQKATHDVAPMALGNGVNDQEQNF
jgi:urease accessory protein UreF